MTAPAFVAAVAAIAWATVAHGQPGFPHKYHVEEEELSCATCHGAVSGSRAASDNLLPDRGMCLDCHEDGDVVLDYPAAAREIRFDHARHIEGLGMECATCHQGLDVEAVRTTGYLPAMDACMSCHDGAAAPRECEACHTVDRARLRPDSHGPEWKDLHGAEARISDATCLPCHATSDCQQCHDGADLLEQALLGAARQTPFAPELAGTAGTALQRVHGLNFRFRHGLEARAKSSECLVCHELDTGDFCAECHTGAGGLRPVWHGGSDWVTLGAGSGGGRHAQLARRDLERCAACHEARGDDPACLQCHMDRTPGRGNDPRTHADSFADDVGQGDFHDSDDAVCFTCHTASSAADGFCSYCHEAR